MPFGAAFRTPPYPRGLKSARIHALFEQGMRGRGLSLPSCLPSATLKLVSIVAKKFLDLNFLAFYGLQDGFSLYLVERFISYRVSSKYTFHGRSRASA